MLALLWIFFFQAEDGIRDLVRSRGLGDVYKRQGYAQGSWYRPELSAQSAFFKINDLNQIEKYENSFCLLYTSDAADERSSVDLGGRRIIKKKKECCKEACANI